ncbi:hypothetical protein BGZ94_006589 [Podila epigama]|nr:hypothetical protein BGZ94_006589 [Podila epigama]
MCSNKQEQASSQSLSSDQEQLSKAHKAKQIELEAALASLYCKLEILQPAGFKPSDIQSKENTVLEAEVTMDEDPQEQGVEHSEGDVILSQNVTSQQSILLWDELRVLVTALISAESSLVEQAEQGVIDLGLDLLEDSILHQLCTNEIFSGKTAQDQEALAQSEQGHSEDESMSLGLPYQASKRLYQILFLRKASDLKSIPSRLFLNAFLRASKGYGRAMVDGVLQNLVCDLSNYSKFISELVLKAMKEQTSAGHSHFLSQLLDPTSKAQSASSTRVSIKSSQQESFVGSALCRIPVVFVSEIHMNTALTLLGFANMPCPLPSRLWAQLKSGLDQLWDEVSRLFEEEGRAAQDSAHAHPLPDLLSDIVEQRVADRWLLRMYCAPHQWEALTKADSRQQGSKDILPRTAFRLYNLRLTQLLMSWTLRQGPQCQDVAHLIRLHDFCATRLDAKQSKALVAKLDGIIKKKKATP